MDCPICSGPMTPRLKHREFEMRWCDACEFGRLAGEFTPEWIAGLYDDATYYTHKPKQIAEKPPSLSQRILTHLAWRLDHGAHFAPSEVSGKTACDIGCGAGWNVRRLKDAGFDVAGIEPDETAAATARQFGTVIPGTAGDLPVKNKFDVVLMSHVLEHCISLETAIENAKRIMADGGTLVVEVPNNAALGFKWFGADWPFTDIPRHLSFFTEKSLRAFLAKHGLRVTKTTYVGYLRQFYPDWRDKIGRFSSGWPLLAASALSSKAAKYDSVRVHARL